MTVRVQLPDSCLGVFCGNDEYRIYHEKQGMKISLFCTMLFNTVRKALRHGSWDGED